MPKYDYKCLVCNAVFEREHGMNEEKRIKCPECNKSKVRKVINPTRVIYTDEGFTKYKGYNPDKID